jgi:flagellar motor protein MotB
MRWFADLQRLLALGLLGLVLSGAIGCAQSPAVLQGQLQQFRQDQLAVSRQNEQLQSRASSLDRDNQELGTQLAQSRQQIEVLDDQLSALREQLGSVTLQLARSREEKVAGEKKIKAMTASMQRRGGVTITPNSSYGQVLPAIDVPGVPVRRDGDVIRIELPCNRLFEPGTARFRAGAIGLITTVGGELVRAYPHQRIGIEGHTDSDPVRSPQWQNNHQLSVGRAIAVYEVLTTQARVAPGQLHVSGHGANHPVYSNGPLGGKQRNRRVELVVYPEKVGR